MNSRKSMKSLRRRSFGAMADEGKVGKEVINDWRSTNDDLRWC